MKFKSIQLLLFVTLTTVSLFSQEAKLEQAIQQLQNNNPEYIDAIRIYEKVIEEGGLEDEELFLKIASSYYFNADYANANKWFEKYYSIANSKKLPIYNYWYGQTLKAMQQYQKADALLAPFYEKKGERYRYSSTNLAIVNNNDRYSMLPFQHNTAASDYSAFLQENTLYFITTVDNGKRLGWANQYTSDVYVTDNSNNKLQKPAGELNSDFNEGSLVITKDGKTMYFTRNAFLNNKFKRTRKGEERTVTLNIYKASFIDGKWKNIEPCAINNLEYSVGHPALSIDEKTLYFSSNMPGGVGDTDLYSVPIKDNGNLGKPVNMTALNTIGKEMFPFVNPKTGHLYFSSDRSEALGGLDVFVSKLEAGLQYRKAYNIGTPINSSFDDFGYMINASDKGYFSSNRKGEAAQDDIYHFLETAPFTFPIILAINGIAKDSKTAAVLAGLSITLFDKKGNVVETVLSDANGMYVFGALDVENLDYVKSEKEGYITSTISLDPKKLANKNANFDVNLIPVLPSLSQNISIVGKTRDKNNTNVAKGLADAKITLYDINGNVISFRQTNSTGNFNFDAMNRRDVAFIRAEKDGYLTAEVAINGNKITEDTTTVNFFLSTSKIEKKEGTDIASILNTIYFDTGKNTIREDAKIELEKIVQVLKQYDDVAIQIGSHTDSRSKSSFNQKLSEKRAASTYAYLVGRGVSTSRLTYKGFGESKLINRCSNGVKCSEEEHQLNRRSEFIVTNIQKK
ncbi:OmpA family protein [uncultured Polaribacter sp.]|uniref:OmpA family protein n=1 Tax=uncultured Polaribacter sp. TaxID=174711 RepID=UPI00262F5280|nr:OmpA family protein [uncultured Polaribacter sp.]